MLRFNYAINTLLGALLVTPALTLGVQHNESLESALKRTASSLDELGRIEKRLRQQDPAAIADVMRTTERPLATSNGDPAARDTALQDLRGVVGKLQRELDELESKATPQELTQIARLPVVAPAPEPSSAAPIDFTVGLDDALRRRLGERARPVVAETPRVAPKPVESVKSGDAKTAFEAGEYTADALRLGRAHYRKGEYDKALDALKGALDAESLYWKARCLEKLERSSEAITAYNQVLALPDAGYSGQRAKEDLEFLEWRLQFERTRGQNGSKVGSAKQSASGAQKP
jgi:tetratricopeptide (TPR) repeat protein